MRNVGQIKNLKGKRVLLRVDFNVPIKNGKVVDDFRIKAALPTVKFLQEKGAKLILITHLGNGEESLLPVYKVLRKLIKVSFVDEVVGFKVKSMVADLKNGEVLMLENLRKNKGEKECNKIFAVELSKFGDIYVNESFPVDHRKDASIVLLPKLLPSYAGFQVEREVKNLSHILKPKHPFLFILGGAKFSTKMPLIKKYIKSADFIFIGGALANDFLKAQGYELGKSLVDDAEYDIKFILQNKKIILPIDVLVKSGDKVLSKNVDEVLSHEYILDIGPKTIENLVPYIKKSKLILWNGPLGKYEDGGAKATKEILKIIARAKGESIIGGGDTVSLISKMKITKDFSFVSTGGGAMLDFLTVGTLPGVQSLK